MLNSIHYKALRAVERHYTANFVNDIVNHPSVAPHVLLTSDHADLTAFLNDRRNVALVGPHGAMVLEQLQPGLYEAHTQVLPAGRGEWSKNFVLACLHWMFCSTDAVEVVTRVPEGNLMARGGMRMLERVFGPLFLLRRTEGWMKDGKVIPADVYSLPLHTWLAKAPGLNERGLWFHDALDAEYARLNKKIDQHADDETHDRAVGAALEMLWLGQPQKALVFYNRWASIAGYQPIRLVSEEPLAIDIRDSVLVLRPSAQTFWVAA